LTRDGAKEQKILVRERTDQLPPLPSLTRFQQTLSWGRDPAGLLIRTASDLGDCFTLTMTGPPMIVVSHPDHVARVFEASPDDLLGGDANAVFSLALGPRNLLSLDGVEHDRIRREVGAPFTHRHVPAFADSIAAVVRRHVVGWRNDATVVLQNLMQRVALDVILEVALGSTAATDAVRDAVLDLVDRVAELGTRRRSSIGRDLLAVARRRVQSLCSEHVARSHDSPSHGDALLNQLAARIGDADRDSDTVTVVDQLVSLLIAGHETTATALTWAMCRILDDDDLLDALRAEGNEGGGGPTPLLDATILETLRLHPAFPVLPRTVTRRFEIGPYRLLPGDVVAPCSYLSHRHPAVWENPERFDPTRFLGKRPGPAEFYPFGSGARRCLGMHFALLEMRIVLTETLRRWDVRPVKQGVPRPIRRSLTLAPEGGFPVVLRPRPTNAA
jgi:cytochrome P450